MASSIVKREALSIKKGIQKLIPSRLFLPLYIFIKQGKIQKGLPPGIDFATLNHFCEDHYGQSLRGVYYIRISGWKSIGAYRLLVKLNNTFGSLIYKNASYSKEIIPAINGLPILPGPPEFEIYRAASDKLASYLPVVYICSNYPEEARFSYLMEDLFPTYRHIIPEQDLQIIVNQLDSFHNVLSQSLPVYDVDKLLSYNFEYSEKLLEYAKYNLGIYFGTTADNMVKKVLDRWQLISKLFLKTEFYDPRNISLIHGDLNRSNVHLNIRNGKSIKVVDWEWAGLGVRHMDYVSLLKGLGPESEQYALNLLHKCNPHLSSTENAGLYYWCSLGRRILDGSFLSKQQLEHHETVQWLPSSIRGAMAEIMRATENISSNDTR